MKVSLNFCAWCEANSFPEFVISETAWQLLREATPEADGLEQGSLCPLCVNSRLEALGMKNIAVRFKSGAFAQE